MHRSFNPVDEYFKLVKRNDILQKIVSAIFAICLISGFLLLIIGAIFNFYLFLIGFGLCIITFPFCAIANKILNSKKIIDKQKEYKQKIIAPVIDDALKTFDHSESIYKESYIYQEIYKYKDQGYFVDYKFDNKKIYYKCVFENTHFDLKGKLCDIHSNRCEKDYNDAIKNYKNISDDDLRAIVSSWVSVNNAVNEKKLNADELISSAEQRINVLKAQEEEWVKNQALKLNSKESKYSSEELQYVDFLAKLMRSGSRTNKIEQKKELSFNHFKESRISNTYKSHCWNCGAPISERSNKKCPACKTYYICAHCGYCKCKYNASF